MNQGISQPVDPIVTEAIKRKSEEEAWAQWAKQEEEKYSGEVELPLYVRPPKWWLRQFVRSLIA